MATYPLFHAPTFPYRDHLMVNKYIADVKKGLTKANQDIASQQIDTSMYLSQEMQQNANFIAEVVSSNASMLSNDLRNLSRQVEFGLDRLGEGISSLRSDFDISMGKVMTQFEMLRDEMQTGLDHIVSILENKRKTDAKEHFNDALEFYHEGCRFQNKPQWFDDALKHFLASVDQYERNPLAHFHIGHIYHYEEKYQDFSKALEHYKLCSIYGEADEKDFPTAAQGYFYAGWLQAAAFNSMAEAITLTKEALQLDENLGEAHYHLAKFYSIEGMQDEALNHLRIAIVKFDRNYCIKAAVDPDFDSMRDLVNDLFQDLRNESRDDLDNLLESVDQNFDPKDDNQHTSLQKLLEEIRSLRQEGTYFSCLDGISKTVEYEQKLKEAVASHSKYYEPAVQAITQFEKFMQEHTTLSKQNRDHAEAILSKAKQSLSTNDHSKHDDLIKNLKKNKVIMSTNYCRVPDFDGTDHEKGIRCFDFSPCGKFIASSSDEPVRIWNTLTGKEITRFGGYWYIADLAYGPDGNLLTASDETVRLWDVLKGVVIKRFVPHDKHVSRVANSPKGTHIACTGGDYNVLIWDTKKTKILQNLSAEASVKQITFSPDGKSLAAWKYYSEVRVWEVDSGKVLHNFKLDKVINCISFSHDGQLFAVGCYGDDRIFMFDLKTGERFVSHERQNISEESKDWVKSIAFSPCGKFIAYSGRFEDEYKIILKDMKTGALLQEISCTPKQEPAGDWSFLSKISFSPNGWFLAHDAGYEIWLWALNWINKADFQNFENDFLKWEEQFRRENGLCLNCGQPIGRLLKFKKSEYCKVHRST